MVQVKNRIKESMRFLRDILKSLWTPISCFAFKQATLDANFQVVGQFSQNINGLTKDELLLDDRCGQFNFKEVGCDINLWCKRSCPTASDSITTFVAIAQLNS